MKFALVFLAACAAAPSTNPAPKLYAAERASCVQTHDTPAAARACMREVDRRYGQDGGL